MSFNFSNVGFPICKIIGDSKLNNKVISLSEGDDDTIKSFNEISLNDNDKFELIPNTKASRDVIYLSGSAGVGKTYAMAVYIRNYKKKFKSNPIFLISEKEEDDTLDSINGIKRIKINDSIIDDPLDLKDFTEVGPCLVIFDDIDSFGYKLKKAIYLLLNKLLKVGRSYKISVLVSSHNSCDGKDTKSMLNEATTIVFYPTCYNRSIKYLAENYIGMNKQDIAKMRSHKSRWCAYIKAYPSCIVQEQNVWTFGKE